MDQGFATLVGRLTRDPEFHGEGDKQRAIFSVAYNRGRGENRKPNFIDCIAWGKRADIMRDFSKGDGIMVTGDLEQDSYTNKNEQRVNRVQVNVNSITATRSTRRPDGENAEAGAGAGSEQTADIPF